MRGPGRTYEGPVRHRGEAVESRRGPGIAKLGAYRHRSSVVELSIRNRAVVGSNPTGGSAFFPPLLAFSRAPAPVRVALPWHLSGCRAATPGRSIDRPRRLHTVVVAHHRGMPLGFRWSR